MQKENFFEVLSEKLNLEKEKIKSFFENLSSNSKEKLNELENAIKEENFEKIKEIIDEMKDIKKAFENYSILFTEYKNNEDIEKLKEWEELKRIIYSLTN